MGAFKITYIMQRLTKIAADHIQIYYQHFGYDRGDTFIPSEISQRASGAIHHIQRRGMGGNSEMDRIENLMALTDSPGDSEHREYGDKIDFKAMLYKIHMARLEALAKPFDRTWMLEQIQKYGN